MNQDFFTPQERETLNGWSFVSGFARARPYYVMLVRSAFRILSTTTPGVTPDRRTVAETIKPWVGRRNGPFDTMVMSKDWFNRRFYDSFLDKFVRLVVSESWREALKDDS